jgi:multiple sugar transport system substrate-binding protein
MRSLRALGWAHERCMRPMRASAGVWERLTGVRVEWYERAGESFADDSLDGFAEDFDIVSYDHPMVGAAATTGALLALDGLLSGDDLAELARDSIGPSHLAYAWGGHQWGLATDAACQVSVVRPDLLPDSDIPTTWEHALLLARELPGAVTTSLSAHDAICSLLTLCASAGTPISPDGERFADPEAALPALEWLRAFSSGCHPSAWDGYVVEPMSRSDEIVYGLAQWGYITHTRRTGERRALHFTDIPSHGSQPTGATLGGAGLGVLRGSAAPEAAAAYIAWLTSPSAQREVVLPHGGQPGSRTVWDDPAADFASGAFFSSTRATMENARLRPRDPWWPAFALRAGTALSRGLQAAGHPEVILAAIESIYAETLRHPAEQLTTRVRPVDAPAT